MCQSPTIIKRNVAFNASSNGPDVTSRSNFLWHKLKKCIITTTNLHANIHKHSGRKWERRGGKRVRGRLADKGWHVPASINSPERLTVRNKALYTRHSDKQRSTGTTRPCVCVCVWQSFTMSALYSQVPDDNRHPPETFTKHLISICALSLPLFSILLIIYSHFFCPSQLDSTILLFVKSTDLHYYCCFLFLPFPSFSSYFLLFTFFYISLYLITRCCYDSVKLSASC